MDIQWRAKETLASIRGKGWLREKEKVREDADESHKNKWTIHMLKKVFMMDFTWFVIASELAKSKAARKSKESFAKANSIPSE